MVKLFVETWREAMLVAAHLAKKYDCTAKAGREGPKVYVEVTDDVVFALSVDSSEDLKGAVEDAVTRYRETELLDSPDPEVRSSVTEVRVWEEERERFLSYKDFHDLSEEDQEYGAFLRGMEDEERDRAIAIEESGYDNYVRGLLAGDRAEREKEERQRARKEEGRKRGKEINQQLKDEKLWG